MNPDGVLYLLIAQRWLDEGFGAVSAATLPMPFYSMSIAVVHLSTGLSLLTSARCLNAALIAILVVGLQRLTWVLGGGTRAQVSVVVLALMLPELNGFRSFVIRDFGYWAFSVLALTALVRYAQAPDVKGSVLFFLLCLTAAAFRLEAVLFMLLIPIALVVGQARRPVAAVMLYLPPTIALATIYLMMLAWPDTATNGHWIAATIRTGAGMLAEVSTHIQSQIEGFSLHVLDPKFHDYAAFGLAGGLAVMVVVHIANAASLPMLAIACIGIARRSCGTLNRRMVPLLWAAFAIVVLGLAAVLADRGIIQTRYAMLAGFLIMVVAAFVVDAWYAQASTPSARSKLRWASALVLAYYLGEAGFELRNSNQHYLGTADWLARNTAPSAHIFSNEPRVVYLANRPVAWRDVNREGLGVTPLPIDGYDYWAIHFARDDRNARHVADSLAQLQRVAEFANRKGDEFVIYAPRGTTVP